MTREETVETTEFFRLRICGTKPTARAFSLRTQSALGRFCVGEPVAMHRPAKVSFDGMGFPLILAGGLRVAFADLVSTPLPGRLAALMRELSAYGDERSGEEPNHGA